MSKRGLGIAGGLVLALAAAGCDDAASGDGAGGSGGSGTGGGGGIESICGHPGDAGNELGIGKFCGNLDDCYDTADAPICTIIGNPLAHFCTRTCTLGGAGGGGGSAPDVCGTDASCECGDGGCACTPTACQ